MDTQDSSLSLTLPRELSDPATPDPQHAAVAVAEVLRVQSQRVIDAMRRTTPPPSHQGPPSNRGKTRTPTPTVSHISTPPPTIEAPSQRQNERIFTALGGTVTADQVATASVDELRKMATELQAALHEAKMTAAHHKLQYHMLSQESAAAIERMAVEARMAQYENEVIHVAEQAKAAAAPVQPLSMQEGMIPVQKDLYQRMCREIQHLTQANEYLELEHKQQEKFILKQEIEIASLSDKVILMRDRIRENRDHLIKHRRPDVGVEITPRSLYSTPHRAHGQEQTQPFAALLQASEMASQEAQQRVGAKRGHSRNTHSLSSLPTTPARLQRQHQLYQTPSARQAPLTIPATAPVPRMSALRTPDVYAQQSLPMPHTQGPPSEGTVSASEHGDDDDSEAETEILEPDDSQINESQASRTASQMLRTSQEALQVKRDSFKGSGMLGKQQQQQHPGERMKQTKLFGAVKKSNMNRSGLDEPPAKRARLAEPAVGLGIAGVRD